MKILHTSDWHLGRTLYGRQRHAEHAQLVDELVDVARDVDLVIVSGDVFENANPPIEAEELFFDALARLANAGDRKRAVVVIAGNHDSPDRLTAASPLSVRHGAWIFGRPGDVPSRGDRVFLAEPSVLGVETASGERAVIAAVPYPSESRLRQVLAPALDERDLQVAYNRRLQGLFADLARRFRPDAVNLLTSHLAVRSCLPSMSERALIGGAYQVEGEIFPAEAQYVALGHLHLGQQVPDAPTVVRYAGAPLSMRFSEREYPRNHVLIEARAGEPADRTRVELVPISAGRPLVRWAVPSIDQLEREIAAGLHLDAFVDLELSVDRRLTHSELARIKQLPRDILRIRAILPEASVTALDLPVTRRRDLPLQDLFAAFYREQTGFEPATDLTELLVELATGDQRDQRAAG